MRLTSRSRCLVVALLMVSWLLATNHCALGLMREPAAHVACHACQGAQGKPVPANDERECCRDIVGIEAQASVEVNASAALAWWVEWLWPGAMVEDGARVRGAVRIFDDGPPRAVSFAELVLQGELCSHAPPRLA